jgi:hypothetical protein
MFLNISDSLMAILPSENPSIVNTSQMAGSLQYHIDIAKNQFYFDVFALVIMQLFDCHQIWFSCQSPCCSEMKMNIVDAQNACLSGGVAIGAIADFMLQPYGAIIIGSAAGILSTLGYQIVQVIHDVFILIGVYKLFFLNAHLSRGMCAQPLPRSPHRHAPSFSKCTHLSRDTRAYTFSGTPHTRARFLNFSSMHT